MSALMCAIASDGDVDAADAQNIEKKKRGVCSQRSENIAAQSRAYARTCRRQGEHSAASRAYCPAGNSAASCLFAPCLPAGRQGANRQAAQAHCGRRQTPAPPNRNSRSPCNIGHRSAKKNERRCRIIRRDLGFGRARRPKICKIVSFSRGMPKNNVPIAANRSIYAVLCMSSEVARRKRMRRMRRSRKSAAGSESRER